MRPEDPIRLLEFRKATSELSWDEKSTTESLSKLFHAVDNLAEAEVKYYYQQRTRKACLSIVFRILAWVTGSIGLLLPLLAATAKPEFKSLAPYGYVFIAIAASFLAANSLFGGTNGHIRFVTTQLELEKIITKARISWCRYLEQRVNENKDNDTGFKLVQEYATELHTTTISETGHWGETIMKELNSYQKNVETKKN